MSKFPTLPFHHMSTHTDISHKEERRSGSMNRVQAGVQKARLHSLCLEQRSNNPSVDQGPPTFAAPSTSTGSY